MQSEHFERAAGMVTWTLASHVAFLLKLGTAKCNPQWYRIYMINVMDDSKMAPISPRNIKHYKINVEITSSLLNIFINS